MKRPMEYDGSTGLGRSGHHIVLPHNTYFHSDAKSKADRLKSLNLAKSLSWANISPSHRYCLGSYTRDLNAGETMHQKIQQCLPVVAYMDLPAEMVLLLATPNLQATSPTTSLQQSFQL
jgi:putative NADH-flavin reductase